MTVRRVWLGSTGPFLYDDSVLYIDEDGVISPDNQQAIATDGQIVIQSPPSSPVHAVRKQDLDDALTDIGSQEARIDALEATTAGLGTISVQDANAVSINGGAIANLTACSAESIAALNSTGDNKVGLHLLINIAGGTNRWGILQQGDAPSLFSGNVAISPDKSLRLGTATVTPEYGSRAEVYPTPSVVGIQFHPSSDTTAYACAFRNAANALVGSIITNAAGTSYLTTSDVRLKNAIAKLSGALDVIMTLNPVRFLWNADGTTGYGFLANELQQEIPDAVTGEPDAVDDDGNIKPQQVDHSKLVPWLTAALQELSQQVQSLTARVAELEAVA